MSDQGKYTERRDDAQQIVDAVVEVIHWAIAHGRQLDDVLKSELRQSIESALVNAESRAIEP